MKKFNIAVVVLWLTMFGMACMPTHETYEDHNWHDEIISLINSSFYSVAGMPTEEMANIPFWSEKLALLYLQITFFHLLFFVLCLNVVAWVKDGYIRRATQLIVSQIILRWAALKKMRAMKEGKETVQLQQVTES